MSDVIKWGAEIPVNGKRPEWLRDYSGPIKWFNPDQRFGVVCWKGSQLNWGNYKGFDHGAATAIRLPADHSYYTRQPDTDRPSDEVPEWAWKRAQNLSGYVEPYGPRESRGHQAFARYIAEHEEAPVDPLLIEAREIVADWWTDNPPMRGHEGRSDPACIRAGEYDAEPEIQQAYNALKRGMENLTSISVSFQSLPSIAASVATHRL